MRLESGEIVGILLFADDIILIANTPEGLEALQGILEIWCSNYKMMESVAMTNIISLDEDCICSVSSTGEYEVDTIAHVESFR